jgi:hypothetical protein
LGDINRRQRSANDHAGAIFAQRDNSLSRLKRLAAIGIAAEDDARSRRNNGNNFPGAFETEASVVEIRLRGRACGEEAADAIIGLLRSLTDDLAFGGVSADCGAAERGEHLAGLNAAAAVDGYGLDDARSTERERRLILVGNETAGAEDASELALLDPVDFHLNRLDNLHFCRLCF